MAQISKRGTCPIKELHHVLFESMCCYRCRQYSAHIITITSCILHSKDNSLRTRLTCHCCVSVCVSVSLSTAAFDQAQWRTTCQSGTALYEESRVAELDRKRAARKQQAINTTGMVWPCDRCGRTCSSRIELFAHRRTDR